MKSEKNSRGRYARGLYVTLFLVVAAGSLILIRFIIQQQSSNSLIADDQIVSVEKTTEVDYMLDTSNYDPKTTLSISSFEQNSVDKAWQGDGRYDANHIYDGESSITVASNDGSEASISLEKNIDLSQVEIIEFMLYLTDPDAFSLIELNLGDLDMQHYYQYPLTNVSAGWNTIRIPKEKFSLIQETSSAFNWNSVKKTTFKIVSRPHSTFSASIDGLRGVSHSSELARDWNIINQQEGGFLSLQTNGEAPELLVRNLEDEVATLKPLSDIEHDFVFSASLAPVSHGRTGLFVRGDHATGHGYYFSVSDRQNKWQILKKNENGWSSSEEQVSGFLEDTPFFEYEKCWLRVEAMNNILTFYFSTDGHEYTKLGHIEDDEFASGELGIFASGGSHVVFDDFRFTQK